jgi:hypothetical protein
MAHELEQYYPGDTAWSNFVSVFDVDWPTCRFQESLIENLCGQTDIAKVVFALTGDEAVRWIHTPAPALDGLSAADCVASPRLVRRLRSMLMRMPI